MKEQHESKRQRVAPPGAVPGASTPADDCPGEGESPGRVTKLIGSDFELGNFIVGRQAIPESPAASSTGREASRLLLGRIDGVGRTRAYASDGWSSAGAYGSHSPGRHYPSTGWTYRSGVYYASPGYGHTYPDYGHARPAGGAEGDEAYTNEGDDRYETPTYGSGYGSSERYDAQDWGRKFLATNAACCYIDLDHLEICTPEVLSARDFVAASRAMLSIARAAMHAADALLPEGQRLVVLANNSDGHGNSYGTHLNFLISREAWRRLFDRLYPDLFVLAAFQASSVVITGQGKVGAENRQSEVDYQLSQRADFIETLLGIQTTYNRPLVNTRDEAHCGGRWSSSESSPSLDDRYARLHCIFYDHNLCQAATFLKVGTMQLVLSALEAGLADPRLILEDPVAALHTWSHDPTLAARAPLADGRELTAVELQRAFLEWVRRAAGTAGFEGYVPDAPAILGMWEDTLDRLEAADFASLRSRLDWVLKRDLIELALRQRRDLDWRSPEIKRLDLMYGSLDEGEGLFWACERAGQVEQIVTHAEIQHFTQNPPDDTRAWTRAWLLQRLANGNIADIDWDHVTFWASGDTDQGDERRTVRLHDPLGFTRAQMEARLGASSEARPDAQGERPTGKKGEARKSTTSKKRRRR